MEPDSTYTAGPDQPGLIRCQACKLPLARLFYRDGRALLEIGWLELDAAHGRCSCGTEWHWTSGDVVLNRMIRRAKTPSES